MRTRGYMPAQINRQTNTWSYLDLVAKGRMQVAGSNNKLEKSNSNSNHIVRGRIKMLL